MSFLNYNVELCASLVFVSDVTDLQTAFGPFHFHHDRGWVIPTPTSLVAAEPLTLVGVPVAALEAAILLAGEGPLAAFPQIRAR